MAGKKLDTFANIAAVKVTETAADTMTSVKFNFPFSIMDKMALVISRIEYIMGNMATAFNGSQDYAVAALSVAATVSDLDNQADPLIVDSVKYSRIDVGAAATGIYLRQPFVKDFTSLAGGGLLVAPAPLYAILKGGGCAAATSCWVKLFYTYVELTSDEYWQLVESRRIISSN